MRRSMWTYPWDIQDCGFEASVADIRDRAGMNGVSLAASYHAGRFLQPRSPVRKVYFPEDGTIYFEPDPSRWTRSRLRPKVAECLQRGDVFKQLIRARERTGLAVSAWTVCLHNMRLGLAHPDVVTRNAFGDANPFSLCPSHPDAREYVCSLVEDLSHSYGPDAVELETPGFMPYAHGYHHEKDGVGLGAEDDFLLSLCFCPSCLTGAARAGVDAEAAQTMARRLLTEAFERPAPAPRFRDLAARGPTALDEFPELVAFARWRAEPVTSLVAAIRERASPESRVYVIDISDGWLCGSDAAALARVCDGMIFCEYDMSADETHASVKAARAAAGDKAFLGAGFRLFHPEMKSGEDLRLKASAAIAGGAQGLNFYNFGLVPAARLDWARDAVGRA